MAVLPSPCSTSGFVPVCLATVWASTCARMYDSVKRLEPMRSVACGVSAARARAHVSASAQATHPVASLRSQAGKDPRRKSSGGLVMPQYRAVHWRRPCALRGAPDLLRGLDHEPQLGALRLHGNVVAMHGAAETAL